MALRKRGRELTGDVGFRRGAAQGTVVPGIAVLLGKEYYADGERGDEASAVAKSKGSRWSRDRAITRRSPLLRTVTSAADELLKIRQKSSPRTCHREERESITG
jgi:hypothetical protein